MVMLGFDGKLFGSCPGLRGGGVKAGGTPVRLSDAGKTEGKTESEVELDKVVVETAATDELAEDGAVDLIEDEVDEAATEVEGGVAALAANVKERLHSWSKDKERRATSAKLSWPFMVRTRCRGIGRSKGRIFRLTEYFMDRRKSH
jgi:hypothetical protein